MVRELAMARLFGASAVNDAFQIAFRIPSLTRNLFAEGSLSSAFVPVFTRYLTGQGKREAGELWNVVATALMLVVGFFCVLGMFFSPQLVRLLAPGFEHAPEKFALAVLLTRIMFPFLLLVALASQAMGVLNACDRFGVPALASTFFNIGSVVIGLALGYTVGRSYGSGLIVSMACGVLAGGLLQLFWQMPSLSRAGFHYRPRLNWSHPGLRQILRLMGPALVGNGALQINVIVNTNLASGLTDASGRVIDGPVSWLAYGFRFMQLPLGLFGVALASVTLPALSRNATVERMDQFRDTLARSLGTVLLLMIPSSVGLAVMGRSMIAAVYQGGRFTAFDTRQTALALTCYSVGLAGYAAIKILAPAFYALDDGRTPMLVSLASIAVNLAAAVATVKWSRMGHAGLAISTSGSALFGSVVLFELLRRRIHGLHGPELAASMAKILTASALMGAVCWLSRATIHAVEGTGRFAQLLDVAISIPLGVAVFYGVARVLRIGELEAVRSAVLALFARPSTSGPRDTLR